MNLLLYKDGKLVVSESGKPLENANALDNLVACIADPSDGDSIVYDGTNHMWKAGGSFDPTITDPQNGDTLVYNAAQSKWVNGAGGSFDPDITNPQDGDTLVYNATQHKWVNGAGAGGVLVAHVTGETGALDKTWQQINDAGFAVLHIDTTVGMLSRITADEAHHEYNVSFITFDGDTIDGTIEFLSGSATGELIMTD